MKIRNMRVRYALAVVLASFLVVPTAIMSVQQYRESQKPRPVASYGVVGYAPGTPYMEYCESAANTSPYKPAQLNFLAHVQVIVLGDSDIGQAWLDHTVENHDDYDVTVRYFAGPADEPHRCKFGLVTTTPERDAATQRFVRGKEYFTPGPEDYCTSMRPPAIAGNLLTGYRMATLQCDFLNGVAG